MGTRRRFTRRKAPALARQLAMLTVILGILFIPVGANIATAYQADAVQRLAQDGDESDPDQTDDESTDTGDQELQVEATEIPTEVPLQTGMVTVWKGECPIDNFDPYQASAEQLSSTCSSNAAANFFVTDSSGGSAQSGGSGSSFDVLAGGVSIAEELPSGYQQPVVVCQSDMSGITMPGVSGAAVSVQVNTEEMVVCTFYNVPAATSTLYIYKWECPAGYDFMAQGADPKTDCTTGQNGVNFHLTDTDPATSDLQTMTGDSTQYAVMFGGIPADAYTITETVPDGYGTPFVWDCVGTPASNGIAAYPLLQGNVLNLDIAGGTTVTCNWYNVPEHDGNEVTVYKWDCPAGTDPMGTEEYLLTECNTQHTGIPFDLADANGSHPMDSQADGTTWNDVVRQATDVTITETIPTGYGDPVVYCWTLLPDETESAMVPSTGGVVTIPNLGDSQWNYYCNWFNIPTGDDTGDDVGAIEIEYRECAAGYMFLDGTNEDDLDQMLMDCAMVDGVEFTIDQAGPDGPTQETGFYGDSHVSFLEAPIGMRTVTQTTPFAATYVVCEGIVSHGGPETGVMVMPVSNGSIQWNLLDDEIVYCNWFVMPEGGMGDVTIYKWDCPLDTDPLGTEEYLLTECATEHLNIPISLTDANGTYPMTTQANGTNWDDVVMGPVTITEDIPDGYGNPVVYCWSLLPDETESALVPSTGGTVTVPATSAEEWNYYCNWFNIPAGDGNEVTIYKWDCPYGTDPLGTEEYLLTECATEHLNIPITLTDDGGDHATTTQANGTTWNNVVASSGTFTVAEGLPENYGDPVVYCWMLLPDETESALVPSTGGMITANVPADVQWNYYCNWFNIPDEEGTELWIVKWECSDGYMPAIDDPDGVSTNCTSYMEGVEFTATPGGNGFTDTNGEVMFDVPYNQEIMLTETVPTGYGAPLYYCFVIELEDEAQVAMTGASFSGVGPGFTIPAIEDGYYVLCHVFNYHADMTDLIIYKWTCPDGYDPYGPGADPLTDCEAGPNGVTFNAEGPNGYAAQTDTGDSIQYGVMFGGLEAGLYTITETPPTGYTGMVWECSEGATYGGGGENMMTFEAMGGEVTCHWLNIPDYDHHVIVYKWICPDGTVASEHDQEWFFENCTQSTDDIQFRLDHGSGSEFAFPSGGMIDWSGIPAGPIGIQEYIPADYENPVVYCSANEGPWEMYPVNSGYWTYDDFGTNWEGSYTFTCHVFNIYGGPGEITVYKWTCPEGYDPYTWGADPYTDCVEGPNGITFTNDGPDGYSSQTDTGDSINYAVYWGGLEPGEYYVEEQVPDGISYVFVWDCYGQRSGELRPTPLTTNPYVTLNLHAGEQIICHWFNVPEDPYGTLTVIKFECSTQVFVSEIDCEIYEGGQTFDLAQWNGTSWQVVATNTTDGWGRYTWYGLDPGEYWVAEQGRDWCYMTSTNLSDDGNWLNVYEDSETVVKVYNCTGKPGKPGKTPTKYPNTGVPASFREDWRLSA